MLSLLCRQLIAADELATVARTEWNRNRAEDADYARQKKAAQAQ